MKINMQHRTPEAQVDSIFGFLKGQLEIVGDILSPTYSDEEYEEFFEASEKQLLCPDQDIIG